MLEKSDIETRSYSGRNMYGKVCLGVTIDRSGLGSFIASVIENLDMDHVEDISDAFRGMATDSMGMGQIVYFPSVPYEEGDEDAEDEEG
jgi:hypothetical protein